MTEEISTRHWLEELLCDAEEVLADAQAYLMSKDGDLVELLSQMQYVRNAINDSFNE